MDRNKWPVTQDELNAEVALRKESVDRNFLSAVLIRPWVGALRKESVDRNLVTVRSLVNPSSRSPQGERG